MAVSVLFIVVPTVLAVAVMLVVRAVAPSGGVLGSMESADGIFSAAAGGLAVVLAFVIFTVFQSYTNARDATGEEAVAAQQMYATAGFFPAQTDTLRGEVVCYSRAVVHEEWPAMAHGAESSVVQTWVDRLNGTISTTHVTGNGQGAALQHMLGLSQSRLDARRTRLAEGQPFVPTFVWVVLIVIALVVVGFQCLFADPAATAFGQCVAMVSIATTLSAALTLSWVLDRPFDDRGARISPSRMQASLVVMAHDVRLPAHLPCGADGDPA